MATESAYQRVIAAFEYAGCKVVERGSGSSATCPVHNDHNPSVSITDIGGRALLWCHAGCDTRDLLAAIGLSMADLYDEKSATYRYDDGRTVHRFYDDRGKKKFSQVGARPTSTLYRLAELEKVTPGQGIHLVEGEADVHAVESAGGVATTAPQGADSFHKVDATPLAGHWVTVVVDRDPAGDKWAAQVATKLDGVAAKYRFVRAKVGKDASDHIAAGYSLADFEPYEPPAAGRGPQAVLTKASTVRMRGVRWLYRGRIPAGMVTLLAGREGIGKSTVSLDIAAKTTRGTLPGRYEGKPQSVVICATEDSWSHTIIPRLMAVGADLDRVYHVAIQEEDGNLRGIVAPSDVNRLEEAFRKYGTVLMVIDPVMAVLDGRVDSHKQQEVQQALEPLVKMCDRLGMAILGLIHVNKSGTTDPLNSIMGSKAFTTLPRSVLYCLEEDDGAFMMCHVKCNVGPKQPSLGYRLQSVRFELPPDEVEDGDEPYIESSRVVWGDEDPRSAGDVLEERAQKARLGEASAAVLAVIEAETGVVTTQQIRVKLAGQHDQKAIENALSRLANAGRITRVHRGTYQSLSVTPF